ncbi:MAG TPA: hypothetical protein VIO34_09820, partial [Candidatus Dormibacteraeota bacterium]
DEEQGKRANREQHHGHQRDGAVDLHRPISLPANGMGTVGRPRDLEIQVVRAAGMGGPARSALKVRDDDGTGPLTPGSGRMGAKDPAGISGRTS